MNTYLTLIANAAFACSGAISPTSWAQFPVLDGENTVRATDDLVRLSTAKELRLRESGVLYVFTDGQSGKKAWLPAACQPLKGDRVKLIDFNANAGGVRGVNSARVNVSEGRCKNGDGWVGTGSLDAIQ